jgi:hypothetical protein
MKIIIYKVAADVQNFSRGVMILKKICSINMVQFSIETGKIGPIVLVASQ